ncbi:cupin domain-containing protein [Streptomyces sp. NPDC093586]|uniref:cupin domain-containing protein n=1 Tax=Streptomyces sp. NPDC093586 TaxID=3366042 RepID=UPI0037F7E947
MGGDRGRAGGPAARGPQGALRGVRRRRLQRFRLLPGARDEGVSFDFLTQWRVALPVDRDTTFDQLVETATDDVVTSPTIDSIHGRMRWTVTADPGMSVVRRRMTEPPSENPARTRAHPGREWLVVLSGTALLMLGHRRFRLETNQAAEFPTTMPHAIGADGGPCEILGIFDRDARRGHQSDSDDDTQSTPERP